MRHGKTEVTREFKLEAVRLIKERRVSYVLAAQDLGVPPTELRNWVKAFAGDKLKAERDILKKEINKTLSWAW
jgi:transposase